MLTIKEGQQVICISDKPIELFYGDEKMYYGDIGVVELFVSYGDVKWHIRKLGADETTEYLDSFEEIYNIKIEDAFKNYIPDEELSIYHVADILEDTLLSTDCEVLVNNLKLCIETLRREGY